MALSHVIRFGLISGALYAGWLAFQGRFAQAAAADDFFDGGSARDRFQALGDLAVPVDPFFAQPAAVTGTSPQAEATNVFDKIFGFDLFSGGVSPAFQTTATPGVSRDVDTVARTIWGEARGDGVSGMRAVAAVIMNRVADSRWPSSPAAVATQPWQFSTWNAGDPNGPKARAVTSENRQFRQALEIAEEAVAKRLSDPTGGADHFYARSIEPPDWANGGFVSARIGGHVFLTGVA